MNTPPEPNGLGRSSLSEQHRIIAQLFARYIRRPEHGHSASANDLLAVAAEHGDTAVDVLGILLASYEATRAREDRARGRHDTP